MPGPVVISVGGSELGGWTEASLRRSKDELTGELSVSLFMGAMPGAPTLVNALHGADITCHIGGHLAFWGTIDRRRGTGDRHGQPGTDYNDGSTVTAGFSRSVNIGPNEYTVKISARGRTKVLIDSSHQLAPAYNILKPTDRQVVEKLLESSRIPVEWLGTEIKLDKVRLRDGALVIDELDRIATENCHFIYETRDGKLRVTDDVGPTTGEDLVLGVNILSFSAEQSEDTAKGRIKVKGQRIAADVWGKDAVEKTFVEVQDQWLQTDIPFVVQHFGDATPEALERRARFEANKRSSESKKVTIEVFHVQSTSGLPWDIGQVHYVEIPPEGIFDPLECVELAYTVQADQTLKTTLTLSPPPAAGGTGGQAGPLGNLAEVGQLAGIGAGRRAAAGVTFAPGQYPQPWSGPVLNILAAGVNVLANLVRPLLADVEEDSERPPMELPPPPGGRNSR